MKNTKALIFLIIMLLGIGFALYSLMQFANTEDPTHGILAVVGVVVAVIFGKLRTRAAHSYCGKCGYHYDYEDDIAFEELNRRTTSGNNAKAFVKLKFTCRCQQCGHMAYFNREFVMAEVKGGNVVERNVENDIKRHFM